MYKMLSDEFLRGFKSARGGSPREVQAVIDCLKRNPEGAFDSKPPWMSRRHARDADPDFDRETANEILEFLSDKLEGGDYEHAMRLLEKCLPDFAGDLADDEGKQEYEDRRTSERWNIGKGAREDDGIRHPARPGEDRRRHAMDDPPPFKGMPRPGGSQYAMDGRRHRLAMDQLNRQMTRNDRARESFNAMFPDAMRIGF